MRKRTKWKVNLLRALVSITFIICVLSMIGTASGELLTPADRKLDAEIFAALDKKNPPTQKQVYLYTSLSSSGKKESGLCNVASMTTLLNRRAAADNRATSFTPTSVLSSNGCKGIKHSGTKYVYSGGSGSWYDKSPYSDGTNSYNISKIWATSMRKQTRVCF